MIESMKHTRREVTLPAATLVGLLAYARGTGDEPLREQGRIAGRQLAERLLSPQDQAATPRSLPSRVFWKRVSDLFASRGWGTLAQSESGPGLGELRSSDWLEAERATSGGRCAFTAGIIQGLLQEVSGAPLEVDELECRASGGGSCRFAFGSRAALDAARDAAAAMPG